LKTAGTVEVVILDKAAASPEQEIMRYKLGDQPQTYTITIKRAYTVEEVRDRIAAIHKGKPTRAIAFDEAEINREDPMEGWLTQSRNTPFTAVYSQAVQVIIVWRGTERSMVTREMATRAEFTEEVREFVGTTSKIRVEPQGMTDWQIKAGHLDVAMETRKMTIKLHDTDGKKYKLTIEGDKDLGEVQEIIRASYKIPVWNRIIIKRQSAIPVVHPIRPRSGHETVSKCQIRHGGSDIYSRQHAHRWRSRRFTDKPGTKIRLHASEGRQMPLQSRHAVDQRAANQDHDTGCDSARQFNIFLLHPAKVPDLPIRRSMGDRRIIFPSGMGQEEDLATSQHATTVARHISIPDQVQQRRDSRRAECDCFECHFSEIMVWDMFLKFRLLLPVTIYEFPNCRFHILLLLYLRCVWIQLFRRVIW
jgi:hypothetical protein